MGTYEDFDLIIRLLVIFLLFPFPRNWHPRILSTSTLCYVKRQLPFSSSGALDFAVLDELNWGLLPIEQLWPVIRDTPAVSPLLQEHCSELSYDQILWVAKNDPLNRVLLLTNHECMLKVSFIHLDLDDFLSHLLELPIYSVFDLNSIPEEAIIEGLQRIAYRFPSRLVLEDFLSRLPIGLLQNPYVLEDVRALNLFSVNFLFKQPNNVLPYSKFFFNMQWTFKTPRWKVYLLELFDLVEGIPSSSFYWNKIILEECMKHIQDDLSIRQFLSSPEFGGLYFSNFRLLGALQLRDTSFFSSLGSKAFTGIFGSDFGPFDQFRIISSLLPDELDAFIDYFEAGLFDQSVLEIFFASKPRIFDAILPRAPPKLLRFLSLRPPEPQESNASSLCQVVTPPSSLEFGQIVLQHNIQKLRFHHRNFRIKYADDAVIDMGGPLLDWITGVLQRILDLGLFSKPVEFEAEAREFLDARIFKLIGLLHGKLFQIGSGPAWIPSISGTLLDNISALIDLESDPAESVRLFNEFCFPSPSDPVDDPPFRLCSHAEIQLYLRRIERLFNSWRDRAWEQYYDGMKVFILDQIPRPLIHKLLLANEPVTAAQLSSKSEIEANPDAPFDLSEIWLLILESLSQEELVRLLIFVTGQPRLMRISVHFVINSQAARLPTARTCFQKLFLYLAESSSPESLTESLRTSIHNYQGFGNI